MDYITSFFKINYLTIKISIMKSLIYYFFISMFLSLLVLSCSKEEDDLIHSNNSSSVTSSYKRLNTPFSYSNCEYDLTQVSEEGEHTKIILSKFVGESLRDVGFREYLLNEIYFPTARSAQHKTVEGFRRSTEFVIAEHLDDRITMSSGISTTFRDYFFEWFRALEQSVLSLDDLCRDFESLVIDLPWWADQVIEDSGGINNVTCGSIPYISTIECNGQRGWIMTHEYGTQFVVQSESIKQHVAIYVKDAEQNILFDASSNQTIDGRNIDNVIQQYFSFNPNCNVSRTELISFMRTVDCNNLTILDGLSLIDFIARNCAHSLMSDEICGNGIDDDNNGLIDCDDPACADYDGCGPTEICDNGIDDDGDGLIDQADVEDCPCVASCGRDCKKERNSLAGFKFAGSYIYNHICQQFGEAITHLQYTFLGVDVCDPENNGASCPTNTINNSVIDLIKPVEDFFLLQKFEIRSDDNTSTWPVVGVDGVVHIQKRSGQLGCNNKCWYDYWKAWPKYFDTDVPYLTNFDSHWNGDLIGDKVKFILLEKDNVTVATTYSTSLSVNVSTNMTQGGSAQGENNGTASTTSYSFSTGITNSTSFSQNNKYLQDIELGEYTLFYCDEIVDNPDPHGGPFIWTGHIPNNYNGVPVYHLFYYD